MSGMSVNPTLATIKAVAKAVGMSLSELLQEPNPEERQQLQEVLHNRQTRRAAKPQKDP